MSDPSQQSTAQGQDSTAAYAGIKLGRLFGVGIHLDWSLLIIFALIAFNLGVGVFPRWHPDWSPALTWATALAAAVLFFGSVLVHELSHAVVARTQGIPVRRITLFLFGGLAHMDAEPPSPKAEFLMAVVGPITSIVIGVLAILAGGLLAGDALDLVDSASSAEAMQSALREVGPVASLLLWLGPINLLLGVFNMVPGFPLDGGRVLRSILWAITGDLTRATRWASGAGQLFAWILMGIGVMNLFSGGLIQGLWLVLIGWFLNNAARMSYQQLLVREALKNVPVARVMQTRLERIPPDLSIERFVREHLMASDQHAFPVELRGQMLGLVTFDDVRKVPHPRWGDTTVEQVMTPAAQLSMLPPDAAAQRALDELSRRDADEIPVAEGTQLLGLVRRRDLMKWLALHSGGPASARPRGI